MQNKEIRTVETKLETRDSESNEMVVSGYFIRFNERTKICDGMYEEIAPTAFGNLLKNDVRGLWNHEAKYVLGRYNAGTLSLKTDDVGVYGEIKLPDTSYARDLYQLIKRGDVNQCSFGFNILSEESERLESGDWLFRLTDIDLHEVSVVTFPAYENTSVQARSRQMNSIEDKKRELLAKLKGGSKGEDF